MSDALSTPGAGPAIPEAMGAVAAGVLLLERHCGPVGRTLGWDQVTCATDLPVTLGKLPHFLVSLRLDTDSQKTQG